MKTRFTLFAFLLLSFTGLDAQTGFLGDAVVPLKPQSPLFGKDIVIHDNSNQNQHQVIIRSAFNGWLFAEYSYIEPSNNSLTAVVMISKDNGITWTLFFNLFWPGSYRKFSSMDMAVSGDSVSNLKLFLAWVASNDSPSGIGDTYVWRYNGETGVFEDELIGDHTSYSIAIANDVNFPATNSTPYSLGIIYSKYSGSGDSIIFCSSSNGGMSIDNRRVVATSGNRFHKVALTYGRSLTWNSGRYFAAWEEQNGFGEMLGHIYTSHTNPNFNSPFTTPVNIDELDPAIVNQCQNPAIACQYNAVDNDSSNLTEVIMFERYKPSVSRHDIGTYYNLQACSSTYFKPMTVTDPTHVNLQPDLAFNPYDSTFMFTYYDTTVKKLPFLKTVFNLPTPNNWTVVNSGYNDSPDITAPFPKVELNIGQPEAMNAWIANRPNGNGIVMFDAPYSTYTGVSGHGTGTSAKLIGSYPNPCSNKIKISFELKNAGNVTIDVMSILGQAQGTITNQEYSAGKHTVRYDVSGLPAGSYLYTVRSGEFSAAGKITVVR